MDHAAHRSTASTAQAPAPTGAGGTELDPQQSAQQGQSAELNAAGDGRAHGPPKGSVPPVVNQGAASFRLQDFEVGQANLLGPHQGRLAGLAQELNAEAAGVQARDRQGTPFETGADGKLDYSRPITRSDGSRVRYGNDPDPQDRLRGWNRVEVVSGSASPEGETQSNARLAEARAITVAATLEGLGGDHAHGKAADWLNSGSHGQRGDRKHPETWPTQRHVEVRVRAPIPLKDEAPKAGETARPTAPEPTPDMSQVNIGGLEKVVPRNAIGATMDKMPSQGKGVIADVGVEIAAELGAIPLQMAWVLKGGVEMYSALNDAHLQDKMVVSSQAYVWGFAARASGLAPPVYDANGFSGPGDPEHEAELKGIWDAALAAGRAEVNPAHEAFFRSPKPKLDLDGRKAAAMQQLWETVCSRPGVGVHVKNSDTMDWPGRLR